MKIIGDGDGRDRACHLSLREWLLEYSELLGITGTVDQLAFHKSWLASTISSLSGLNIEQWNVSNMNNEALDKMLDHF